MNTLACYIVADDPVVNKSLIAFTLELPWLCLKGSFSNADQFIIAQRQQPVEVIFVDERLCLQDGGAWLAALEPVAKIVLLTTDGQSIGVVNTINTVAQIAAPFTKASFMEVALALKQIFESEQWPETPSDNVIIVRDHRVLVHLSINDILYIEALGDYLKLHTAKRFYTLLGTIKQMEEKLCPFGFIRIHRSFIVAWAAVDKIEGGFAVIGQKNLPVSDRYKALVQAAIVHTMKQ